MMLTSKVTVWRVRVESSDKDTTTAIWYDVGAIEQADAQARALAKANQTDPGRAWRVTFSERGTVAAYRTKVA